MSAPLPTSELPSASRGTHSLQRVVRWQTHGGYQEATGRECTITLEPRPHYCDRGNFIAKLHPVGKLARSIDGYDLWPRYYFDEERAKLEIEAWLQKRGQLLPPNAGTEPLPPEAGVADKTTL